ncbi:hypothetical protein ILYODFUR_024228 [Ilyodon furcidens]|uniref:Uncharacterized protein n=1 Tax=Ilyodon furcidens TaxID=33524 RepID=A0ABV0VGQ3_9TELE
MEAMSTPQSSRCAPLGRKHDAADRGHIQSGNTASMIGCSRSATIRRQVVRVQLSSTWMEGAKVSLENIAPTTILPSPACRLLIASWCHIVSRSATHMHLKSR